MRSTVGILSFLLLTTSAYSQPTIVLDKNGRYVEHIDKETDIEMISVEGGTFNMGSNDRPEEQPIHRVRLNSYYISKYEITQQQWYAVVHYNYSHYDQCPNCPVEMVSWGDIAEYIYNLNKLTGKHYRLPTEAEWEYAARGGNKSQHHTYSGNNDHGKVAWCGDHYLTDADKTHPVGQKEPNELGLYDMSGNVLEWCSDWYDADYYKQNVTDNPKGPATGHHKVIRGGSYLTAPATITPSYRIMGVAMGHNGVDTGAHWKTLGFRIVRDR